MDGALIKEYKESLFIAHQFILKDKTIVWDFYVVSVT